ncbi:N(4)-acetylcytidine aminohydrolase [Enterobacter asburiae]|uniref:N(4)-acetylcytidine aminohydrolase n=1 Tax=Enterobacter asburiae TaxID=61645 RepID=UPI001CBE1E42|nr:N(4)-acetylcytidine aminohydrolase [Enterobacter asburiae]UAN37125.1 ASCH domain-containing protein [Enterobacter asburiae]
MQPNDITFFQRFQDDILAGRKTITIRDKSESHFKTGDILRVGRYEDNGYFCTIEVTGTSTVTFDTLTQKHAEQENMTLDALKSVIAEIYPRQNQFYVIDFKCL